MLSSCTMQALFLATTTEEHLPLKRILPEQKQQPIASRLALPSTRIQLTFCKSIALPSEDNSFGELKKIGTEVISREERDRQRAEEQKQQQTTTTANATTTTNTNKSSNNDSRYNYNYTWDYETNSPVDPDEVRRLQREHGYNNTTATNDDDRKENTSSNKSSSKEDREDKKEISSKEDRNDRDSSNKSSKYETDSRGYLTFDGYVASQGYTPSDIDRIERNSDGIRAEYNEYLNFMETVTSNFPEGKSSYSCFGKTYSDYYDFLYEISIRYGNTDGAWEYNGKIYFDYDEYTDAMSDKMHEEEQWEIEHFAEGTLELVNEARSEEGLPPLTLDPDLVEVAEIRARELCELYSHTRPNGEAGITAIREYGCDYFYRAENIAKGTSNAIEIKTWLSSSGHRKQILSENYQYYGAATISSESGTTYAIQVFGGLANP